MKFNPLLPWEEQKIAWGMKDIFLYDKWRNKLSNDHTCHQEEFDYNSKCAFPA